MTLRVYNSLSRTKETFETVQPGRVGMYLCGPTVYKPAHIGHMVGPVIFDTIKRLNQEDGTAILLVEQNAGVAFSVADYGYIMESGQIVMEGDVAKLRGDKDIQSFYLGMGEEGGARQSFRDVKHYKRRKRWLS